MNAQLSLYLQMRDSSILFINKTGTAFHSFLRNNDVANLYNENCLYQGRNRMKL